MRTYNSVFGILLQNSKSISVNVDVIVIVGSLYFKFSEKYKRISYIMMCEFFIAVSNQDNN